MKVLFDNPDPFMLMHGGFQIQIEHTKNALEQAGVEVEHLRWWDDSQSADVLHYFGRPRPYYVEFARQKGMKVVVSQMLTGMGSRTGWRRILQKAVIHTMRRTLPAMITDPFGWEGYCSVDACLLLTGWEAFLMRDMFGVAAGRVHVVPNGVDEAFFANAPTTRGPWLICTGAIADRKRVAELAEAAVLAQTPVWIIGKPYSESDPYAQRFLQVARQNPKLVRYEGAINDRRRLAAAYREARGFVLLSTRESLSLSALEAAACETPLLLSDLPWARTVFGDGASYCPIASASGTAPVLRRFYDAAPTLPKPPTPLHWIDVGRQIKSIYEGLLKTSR